MSSIQNIQESLKELSVDELLAVIAAATAEAKKKAKVVAKVSSKEKGDKKGSMPKGVLPPQLEMSFAYVDYTLLEANKNGWQAFNVKGQETQSEGSVERDGVHVFPSTGKPLNRKQAMSLSKYLWSNKEKKGTDEAFYEAFKAQHVPLVRSAASEAAVSSDDEKEEKPKEEKPKKEKKAAAPKKTDEEKAAEKQKKADEKTAEKKRLADEKTAEKKRLAEEKSSSSSSSSSTPAAKAVATPKKAKKAAAAAWSCPNDGQVHPWDWKGKKFLRNSECQVWTRTDDGEAGVWQGVYKEETDSIDTSVEEPEFEEDE
jgi:hypothetical protein